MLGKININKLYTIQGATKHTQCSVAIQYKLTKFELYVCFHVRARFESYIHFCQFVSTVYLNVLPDGAALFYTSVKEEKNCDLLHKYLLHRIYGFPFTMPAYVVEKDSVFM